MDLDVLAHIKLWYYEILKTVEKPLFMNIVSFSESTHLISYLVYIKFSLCCNLFRKITLYTLAFLPVRTKIARPCTNYAYGHLTQACIYIVYDLNLMY